MEASASYATPKAISLCIRIWSGPVTMSLTTLSRRASFPRHGVRNTGSEPNDSHVLREPTRSHGQLPTTVPDRTTKGNARAGGLCEPEGCGIAVTYRPIDLSREASIITSDPFPQLLFNLEELLWFIAGMELYRV